MTDKEFAFSLLEKAYKLTENVTPKKYDCGELCGGACCKNLSTLSSESGMMLLPFEKEFLIENGACGYTYKTDTEGTDYLVCEGKCNRKFRPFACRVFPYYADFSGKRIKIKKDIRAAAICPVINARVHSRANIYFLRNVKKAVHILCKDKFIKRDFEKTSDFIDSLYYLYKILK